MANRIENVLVVRNRAAGDRPCETGGKWCLGAFRGAQARSPGSPGLIGPGGHHCFV